MNDGPKSQLILLLDRIRRDDELAARELVEQYGSVVRREIRFRLRDSRLYRVVGASDLFQSAMTRFFWGLRLGKFEASSPEELVRLLQTIAERRVYDAVRFWRAERRDLRREPELAPLEQAKLIASEPTPSQALADQELLDAVLARLPAMARQVHVWRRDGLSWEQIAQRLPEPTSPEAARKQYDRALDRVATELRVEESV